MEASHCGRGCRLRQELPSQELQPDQGLCRMGLFRKNTYSQHRMLVILSPASLVRIAVAADSMPWLHRRRAASCLSMMRCIPPYVEPPEVALLFYYKGSGRGYQGWSRGKLRGSGVSPRGRSCRGRNSSWTRGLHVDHSEARGRRSVCLSRDRANPVAPAYSNPLWDVKSSLSAEVSLCLWGGLLLMSGEPIVHAVALGEAK